MSASQPRTIWYVCKYVAPPQGESVGGRGYEIMRELAARGHRCVVITSDANHLVEVPHVEGTVLRQQRDGLDLYWLRTFKTGTARSWRRILGWLHFEWRLLRFRDRRLPRPDAVIVSSLSLLTVLNGLRLKRRYGAVLVFEVRDIWPLSLVAEGGYAASHPLVRALGWIERLGYRRADRVVGTMPGLHRHVRRVLGGDREVDCVPQGFSARVAQEEPAPPAERAPGELVVGYAGTVGAGNALETLVDVARLLAHDPSITFRVLGDGPLLETFRERCADLPAVTFVPRVPKGEVAAELARCDLLYLATHPSIRWEFGQSLNKLIDYMLAARPVLASYSGYPSMIDEAGCGTFVPAGDALAAAAEIRRYATMTSAERAAMGRRGREWLLAHRSFERLASDYERILFPTVVAPPGGRRA